MEKKSICIKGTYFLHFVPFSSYYINILIQKVKYKKVIVGNSELHILNIYFKGTVHPHTNIQSISIHTLAFPELHSQTELPHSAKQLKQMGICLKKKRKKKKHPF